MKPTLTLLTALLLAPLVTTAFGQTSPPSVEGSINSMKRIDRMVSAQRLCARQGHRT